MSFTSGDKVFLCSPSGPIEATYIGKQGSSCVISVGGARMAVLCSKLRASAAACPVDAASFTVGQRVVLRMVDTQFGERVWPAEVKKTFNNGRVSVALDGLSHPQVVDASDLVKI